MIAVLVFAFVCVQCKGWVRFGCRLFVIASLAKAARNPVLSGYKFGAT